MQILYLLIDDGSFLSGKDYCFHSNYRFEHSISKTGEITLIWHERKCLPPSFFSLNGSKSCNVANISAIIGENGSGKTSLMRYICNIFLNRFDKRFVLVYEEDDKWYVRYGNTPNQIYVKKICKIDYSCELFGQNAEKGERIERNNYGISTISSMAYLTTHFSLDWETLDTFGREKNIADLSTSGLMEIDARDMLFNASITDANRYSIISHRLMEMKRILDYLYFKNGVQKNRKKDVITSVIDSMKIKNLEIRYNSSIINKAYVAANQMKNNRKLDPETKAIYERICNTFDEIKIPTEFDFIPMVFLAYVAGVAYEHISANEGLSANNHQKNEYLMSLISRCEELGNHLKEGMDIHALTAYIIESLCNHDFQVQKEELPKCRFFKKIIELYAKWKNNDDNVLAIPICDKQNKDELMNVLGEYFEIVMNAPLFLDFEFNPRISSGETAFLTLWGRIYSFLIKTKNCSGATFLIDEIETTMHPAWQKRCIEFMIAFFDEFCRRHNRNINIHMIFASHSPNLLSDIPIGNVIFLSEYNKRLREEYNTFAVNISELYICSYGQSDGPLGSFARGKIQKILEKINKNRKLSDADKMIIDLIGDEFIRSSLSKIESIL
ncbi:MAG: hypothetical protein BWX73_00907 [Lentisphaerae bacterium ADurb.Bin082]|nr:MAG: hypothetical protein BWX73_00907 [Lentisphaerae bacterium ADurb.Bin082]